jgi:hypothetical protein
MHHLLDQIRISSRAPKYRRCTQQRSGLRATMAFGFANSSLGDRPYLGEFFVSRLMCEITACGKQCVPNAKKKTTQIWTFIHT